MVEAVVMEYWRRYSRIPKLDTTNSKVMHEGAWVQSFLQIQMETEEEVDTLVQ